MDITTNMDLDEVRYFCDPHDGVSGAAIRLPVRIKEMLDAVDGESVPVRTVVDLIRSLVDGYSGEITVQWDKVLGNGFILLRVGREGMVEHIWKLICFR